MRREENDPLRAAFEWMYLRKRPRDKHRKKWMAGVEPDLRGLGVENWMGLFHDR